ncbi:MAG: FecR domain-containing protein [Deltaproteobacteria bacterium]|nr:FecR domain-containing protein [Deltaproteobacteria bacterium]
MRILNTDNRKNKISSEAKDWLMKIKSGPMTSRQQRKFQIWLKKNPAHPAELNLMKAIWNGSDVLKDEPSVIMERNRWQASEQLRVTRKKSLRASINFPGLKPVALAACCMLIILSVLMIHSETTSNITYRTETGEQRTVYLSDGSSVHLDAETIIENGYASDLRHISLKQGRAHFSVFHDPARPFVVTADDVSIRAVGTQFNVHKEIKGKIRVAVTEGSVEVKQKPDTIAQTETTSPVVSIVTSTTADEMRQIQEVKTSAAAPKIITAGQEIVIDKAKQDIQITKVNIQKANDWQTGRLRFHKKPLAEVIDEINRYMEKKIVIGDPQIADIPISLNFNVNHRKTFVKALENTLSIVSTTNAKGQTVLVRRNIG